MYSFIERARQSYQLLQDDLSKKIFWARLAYEFDPSSENEAQIVRLSELQVWADGLLDNISDITHAVRQGNKKLVLYGTNATGRSIAKLFLKKQIEFYGFCGRRAKQFTNGLMGKPVIEPDYLFKHPDEFYVIITVIHCNDELIDILKENHFPESQIYNLKPSGATDSEYFEFPTLFRPGTAFVDAGCLNCYTSYLFADWCKGEYSKIYAFEPDPVSYSDCEQRISSTKIRDLNLIQAGLSDHNGKTNFSMGLGKTSYIVEDKDKKEKKLIVAPIAEDRAKKDKKLTEVLLTTLDDTVGEEKVGFIKMDIEGAEFDALHGAEKTIIRDKPLMAICVYHRIGDMLAIMDCLHHLVPEYHFWLRHYSFSLVGTVLYASTDVLPEQ